jgi:hypothetical protein
MMIHLWLQQLGSIDAKFEVKFVEVEKRFDKFEVRVDKLEAKLEAKIDDVRFDAKLDKLDKLDKLE